MIRFLCVYAKSVALGKSLVFFNSTTTSAAIISGKYCTLNCPAKERPALNPAIGKHILTNVGLYILSYRGDYTISSR